MRPIEEIVANKNVRAMMPHSLAAITNGRGLLYETVPSVSETHSSLGQSLSFGFTMRSNAATAITKQRTPNIIWTIPVDILMKMFPSSADAIRRKTPVPTNPKFWVFSLDGSTNESTNVIEIEII